MIDIMQKPRHETRRSFLRHIGAVLAASGISGCAALCRPCGIAPIDPTRELLTHPDATTPFAVFDAHAHVFNGRDLQVAGYLRGPVANDIPDPEVAEAVRKIADYAEQFAHQWSPSIENEASFLVEDIELGAAERRPGIKTLKGRALGWRTQELLLKLLNESAFRRHLRESTQALGVLAKNQRLLDVADSYTLPELEAILAGRQGRGDVRTLSSADHGEGGAILFLKRILSYGFQNLANMWDAFAESTVIRPDAFMSALVDFDYWLEYPGRHRGTPSCLRDQMLISEARSRCAQAERSFRSFPLIRGKTGRRTARHSPS